MRTARWNTRCGWVISTSATGDRLPKVEEVVEGLAINPSTVLKAYRDSEGKGLAVGRPGQGTFIAGTLGGQSRDQAALRRELLAWMRTAASSWPR